MLDIDEITKLDNTMLPLLDTVKRYSYVIFYGLGFDLKLRWKNYIDFFGAPKVIIDRGAKPNSFYKGIPVLASVNDVSDEILSKSVVLVCTPSYRQEIVSILLKVIDEERIIPYPTFLTDTSYDYVSFLKNEKEKIMSFYLNLADDESRSIFEEWLKGKITRDISFYCSHCIPNDYVNTLLYPVELLKQKGYDSEHLYRPERGRQVPNDSLFREKFLSLGYNEVFYDCGAAHGDTYLGFKMSVNNHYKNIVLFEPEEKVFIDLKSLVGESSDVTCLKCGVSNKDEECFFEKGSELGGLCINNMSDKQDGSDKITLKTIDSISLETKTKPTLIKMDIEGAELAALKGAEKTIRTYQPKLIICIYHKDEDIIDIPEYIKSLSSKYKMYVRHFDCSSSELILYCV